MRIGEPARKHGIADTDIEHAIRYAMHHLEDPAENFAMLIGPARNGAMLEVGVLDLDGDDPVAIHAMPLRPKFYPLLGR